MSHTPLPCPFCGAPATMFDDAHGYGKPSSWTIECSADCEIGCYVDKPLREDAIAAWNTRAAPSLLPELVEALREAKEPVQYLIDEWGEDMQPEAVALLAKIDALIAKATAS